MNYKYPRSDCEYKEHRITKVSETSFTSDDGWSLGFGDNPPFMPKVGMVARCYGSGIGRPVRGLFINGVKFWYRTVKQQKQKQRRGSREYKREQKKNFIKNKAILDSQFKLLPIEFRKRIRRFRKGNKKFRWEHEAYEMSCCVDAVKIAKQLKEIPAIEAWQKLDYKRQMKKVKGLFDGHSGNSFGCAVGLAKLYLKDPQLVIIAHGALTPLVGCDDYGCTHKESP